MFCLYILVNSLGTIQMNLISLMYVIVLYIVLLMSKVLRYCNIISKWWFYSSISCPFTDDADILKEKKDYLVGNKLGQADKIIFLLPLFTNGVIFSSSLIMSFGELKLHRSRKFSLDTSLVARGSHVTSCNLGDR